MHAIKNLRPVKIYKQPILQIIIMQEILLYIVIDIFLNLLNPI